MSHPDLVAVKRALISVSDKTGLGEFARALVHEFGVQLISTGGTAKFLREQGLPVTDVSQVTGFPEMMDGRVKTLHPKIHGGLLALRDNPEHVAAMKAHGIEAIDLVCINLYPFEKTVAKPNVTFEEAIENIDIGGPSMVRSASKNHAFVLIVTSPGDYDKVLGDLRKHHGSSCAKHRLKQAQKAFAHTAAYDAKIAEYLATHGPENKQSVVGDGPAWHKNQPHHGSVATVAPAAAEPKAATDVSNEKEIPSEPDNTKLVQRMLAAPDRTTFLRELVTLQKAMVTGTEAAVFEIHQGEGGKASVGQKLVHLEPEGADANARASKLDHLLQAVQISAQADKDTYGRFESPDKNGDEPLILVTLLREAGRVAAASAVRSICRSWDQGQGRIHSLQLVSSYYELFSRSLSSNKEVPNTGVEPGQQLPTSINLTLKKQQDLRYGENPHQKAALYVDDKPNEASVAYAKQLHGKELSYINLLDADAAMAAVKELAAPAACVVKHATPCGYATASTLPVAFKKAYEGDPLAAFGGIVALNQVVDLETAQTITGIDKLLEVIVASEYAPDALELLRSRWKNVRLLAVGPIVPPFAGGAAAEFHMHRIVGGYLVQERDLLGVDEKNWKVVSKRRPTAAEMADLELAWLAAKHLKSNAIAIAKDGMMVGGGAGQQDRVNACRIAIAKAGERARGAVAGSDAFFPFPDGPKLLLEAGITAIIHPGGSVRDNETLDVVNAAGAAMVLTGQRHFKH